MDDEDEGERSNVGRLFVSYDLDGDVSERAGRGRGGMGTHGVQSSYFFC